MSFTALQDRACKIETPTTTRSTAGGPTRVWKTRHNDAACRLEVLSGQEKFFLGREASGDAHLLFLDPDVTIDNEDRVVLDEKTYVVENVEIIRGASTDHHIEAIVARRT